MQKTFNGQYHYRILTIVALSTVLLLARCVGGSGAKSSFKAKAKAFLAMTKGSQKNSVGPFGGAPVAPDLVYVPGGIVRLGNRQVTVAAFGVSPHPVTNGEYWEFLQDLLKNVSEEAYQKALPDSKVWEADLEYGGNMKNRLRYPGFSNQPVTGVSPKQAEEYCKWKTQKLHEVYFSEPEEGDDKKEEAGDDKAAVERQTEVGDDKAAAEGQAEENSESDGSDTKVDTKKKKEEAKKLDSPMYKYRLLTEAEFIHAALGQVNDNLDNLELGARKYPWGNSLRDENGKLIPIIKRGPGNYAGITGEGDYHGGPCDVDQVYCNDFGLCIGCGNVREITGDIYRIKSREDVSDLNPMRKNDALDLAQDYDTKHHNSDISNRIRVAVGASFMTGPAPLDLLSPLSRSKVDEDEGAKDLGFRIAMTPVGTAIPRNGN